MKNYSVILIFLLLAGTMAVPCVSAANRTNPTPPGWVGQFDEWAGPEDMSRYNPQVTPVPIRTMNATTARLYPNVTVCKEGGCMKTEPCPFPFLRCGRSLTVMVVYPVNETRPVPAGPAVSAGMAGMLLHEAVYVYRAGKPDIFLQFDPHSWGAAP